MFSVPFENLDIGLGHPIELSLPSFYDKIVRRRRGGFCYELNGLFAWLLEQLGFKVFMLSARVFKGNQPGSEFDHMILLIKLDIDLIADVGFGDSFLEPLLLDTSEADVQQNISYRITGSDTEKMLQRRRESIWEPQYAFSLTPRRLSDFSDMCHYHQTSLHSHFTQKAVCSMATAYGRTTLSNDRLIMTKGGHSEERKVKSEEDYRTLLKTLYSIDLGEGEPVDRLTIMDRQ
jgi:N-hydroxyarylamine O-acetyltransferase